MLVGESADELQCLKQDILDSVPEEPTVPFIQAPHRIIANLSSKLEKIPHFVSEKVENIPELQHGYDTLKKFTSNCQAKLVAQPVVQQCVQHIQTSINGSVLPVLTELKAAVNGRGQTLITQLHRTTPAITSLANQQFGAKDPIKQAPKLLQAPGASSSALPMIKDVQIVVTDWSDPCAPHKVFAEMHARGLTEKVRNLICCTFSQIGNDTL